MIFSTNTKMVISAVMLMIINYFFFFHNLRKSVITVLVSQFTIIISEAILSAFIYVFLQSNAIELSSSASGRIIINIIVTSLSFVQLFIFKKIIFFSKYIEYKDKNRKRETLTYTVILFIFALISTISSYGNWNPGVVLLINTVIIIIFLTFLFKFINIQRTLYKINYKYQTSISSLKEYEVMIDKFRINTHENKNEFLTIRNMIKEGETAETVVKYIDKIIDNKIKDNDKIMKKAAKIPSGGLRATIYSKLCLMDKLKIKYTLNISREVRTTNLIDLDEELVLKICKILGIFLDNAIEAVKKLRKREISIDIYSLENVLCIEITNYFKGKLDLEKFGNIKYTTKGENHGYGLALVHQLLEEEGNLENERTISKDTFTQTLRIKM